MARTPKFHPQTFNSTDEIRDGIEKIAAREVLSLSDVIRRACLAEIERRDRAETRDDDA